MNNGLFEGLDTFGSVQNQGEEDFLDLSEIEASLNPDKSKEENKPTEETVDESKPKGKAKAEPEDDGLIEIEDTPVEDKSKETKAEENQDEPEAFKVFGNILAENGILSEELLEGFDGTAEGLMGLMQKQIDSQIEDYKASLPDEVKSLIDNYEEGVPFDQLIQTKSAKIAYSNIEDSRLEEDENLQKYILKDYLLATGMKEAKVNKMIEKFEDSGELFDEAKDALGELKEMYGRHEEQLKEQAKKVRLEAEKEVKETLKLIEETVKAKTEIIPGVKLNDRSKRDLLEVLTKPVKMKNGQEVNRVVAERSKDPLNFDLTLAHLINLGVFDGKWDSVLGAASKKPFKDLEQAVKTGDKKITGKDNIATAGPRDLMEAIKRLNANK
jgi:hypothetical protein